MITALLVAIILIAAGGAGALCFGRLPRFASWMAALTTIAGCVLGLVPTLKVLGGAAAQELVLPWQVPYGSFHVAIDPLTSLFLLPVFFLSALAALYGVGYLAPQRGKKALGVSWFFFNLLVASMALLLMARNGVLFLVTWEVMSLSSFFLVTFEDELPAVRRAGWTYLVATHLGTAFLLAFFALEGFYAKSFEFDAMRATAASSLPPAVGGALFLMAVIGFGTKAGFLPLHVWLPEAHPAAPSHVSALMSGVMIKTGIYGILRAMTLLCPPSPWWGYVLVGIGITSGILGVVFALAQHDLKRMLAYSSVENIGIIALGMGIGTLGLAYGLPAVAVLGFSGALLHVINHAIFKGLLFLGAGAVAHGSGTLKMDQLGGLLKRMPWSGTAFFVGAVAISGLPPFNGFSGELLVYLGAMEAVASPSTRLVVGALALLGSLALIGGLAAACFTRAFGCIFLGEPRTDHAARAHESGAPMRLPMALLAAACCLLGLASPIVAHALEPALSQLTRLEESVVGMQSASAATSLWAFVLGGALVLLLLFTALVFVRRRLLAGREVTQSGTWDCGYAAPTARMQYTASSFAQPLTSLFAPLLGTRQKISPPEGIFPEKASLETHTPDAFREKLFSPLFSFIASNLARLRWLQHGRLRLYVLYITLTLLVLLVWKLG